MVQPQVLCALRIFIPGQESSGPEQLITAGNTLFFFAGDPLYGKEVWKSDGTESGTLLVKDVYPGNKSSLSPNSLNPVGFFNFKGVVYFDAVDGRTGIELWRSDGTEAGTYLLKDLNTVTDGSYPVLHATGGDYFYFSAYDGNSSYELWRTDGTSSGTQAVKTLIPGSNWSEVMYVTAVGSNLYLLAKSADTSVHEFWYTDGSVTGTTKLVTFDKLTTGVNPKVVVGNHLVFSVYAPSGEELWLTDSTPGGTTKIVGLTAAQPQSASGEIGYFIYNRALWRSDGTPTGTQAVKDGITGTVVMVDGEVYIVTDTGLWKSDGTEVGTVSSTTLPIRNFAYQDHNFYLSGNDGTLGYELWQSDGTQTQATLIKDINPGSAGAEVQNLTFVDNTLFFTANDGTHGFELWKSDGTEAGTIMVKDIGSGSESSFPHWLTGSHGKLYFFAESNNEQKKLWVSDGTEVGTQPIIEINLEASNFDPNPDLAMQASGDYVHFTHSDGTSGTELWSLRVVPYPMPTEHGVYLPVVKR